MNNDRLIHIFQKLNGIVYNTIKYEDYEVFANLIRASYEKMKNNNLILKLNNFGRPREDVYYSWMRGYCIVNYFKKLFAIMLEVSEKDIHQIGMDDLDNIESFSQSPMADLEVDNIPGKHIRLEVQSGFTGTNDIKKHKIDEAKRVFKDCGMHSYIIHFDIFNGKVAVVDISKITPKYESNSRFEGQKVFHIPQYAFKYKLIEEPKKFFDIVVC